MLTYLHSSLIIYIEFLKEATWRGVAPVLSYSFVILIGSF
jgi:hypothetical protein